MHKHPAQWISLAACLVLAAGCAQIQKAPTADSAAPSQAESTTASPDTPSSTKNTALDLPVQETTSDFEYTTTEAQMPAWPGSLEDTARPVMKPAPVAPEEQEPAGEPDSIAEPRNPLEPRKPHAHVADSGAVEAADQEAMAPEPLPGADGIPVRVTVRYSPPETDAPKARPAGYNARKFARKIHIKPEEGRKAFEAMIHRRLIGKGYNPHAGTAPRQFVVDLVELDIRYYREELEPGEYAHNAQLEVEVRAAALTDRQAFKKRYKTALEQSFQLREGEALRESILDHALSTIALKIFQDPDLMAVLKP